MKCGVSTACFYPQNTEVTLELLCKNDVNYIEIFFNTYSELEKSYIKELAKIKDYYGSNIVSVHPFTCAFEPFMLFTNYERRFNDALEMHKPYFEAMNLLDSKIFVFHGDRFQSKTEDELYFERFAKLRDLGKEFGVIVAQENVERCKSRSVDFLVKMVEYLDGDVSLVFDNKQAIRSKVSYVDFLTKLSKNVVHIHISDNNSQNDCLPLGKGNLDLNNIFDLIGKEKTDMSLIVELYGEFLENWDDILSSYSNLKEKILYKVNKNLL